MTVTVVRGDDEGEGNPSVAVTVTRDDEGDGSPSVAVTVTGPESAAW